MNEPRPGGETGADLARGILLIVAAGIALGVGFNALQRESGPRKGLSWIKREVKLASLEDLQAPGAPGSPDAPGDTGNPGATPTAAAAPPTAAGPGRDDPPAATGGGEAPTPGRVERAIPREDTPASDRPPAVATDPADGPRRGAPDAPAGVAGPGAPAAPASNAPPPARRADLPFIPDVTEPLEVQYATVKKFFDAGAAVFVDARTREEYEAGHIPGALHLDFDDVFSNPSLARSFETGGKPIIAYCGGGDCEVSRNLAFSLIDAGHRKVLVFMGGTAGWQAEGQPFATGPAPGGGAR